MLVNIHRISFLRIVLDKWFSHWLSFCTLVQVSCYHFSRIMQLSERTFCIITNVHVSSYLKKEKRKGNKIEFNKYWGAGVAHKHMHAILGSWHLSGKFCIPFIVVLMITIMLQIQIQSFIHFDHSPIHNNI